MINIELKIYPDELLRKVSQEVKNIDQKLSNIYDQMRILMDKEKGIGLAAPQIGINERFFISKDFSDDSDKAIIFINPEIIEAEDIVESKEGCLSIPGYYDYIKRNNKILIFY